MLRDRKLKHQCQVLTEEEVDEPGAQFEYSCCKSLTCHAQETGVSKGTTGTATMLFQPHPAAARLYFHNWCFQSIHDSKPDHEFFCTKLGFL